MAISPMTKEEQPRALVKLEAWTHEMCMARRKDSRTSHQDRTSQYCSIEAYLDEAGHFPQGPGFGCQRSTQLALKRIRFKDASGDNAVQLRQNRVRVPTGTVSGRKGRRKETWLSNPA